MTGDEVRPPTPDAEPGAADQTAADPVTGSGPGAPVPDAETLAAIATPATVRRAPRIGPFIATGALLGGFVAWVIVLLSSGTTGEPRTAVVLVVTAGGAILGGLVGAALATIADRRSTRR